MLNQNQPYSSNPYNRDFQLIKICTTSEPGDKKYDVKTYNRIIKKVGLNIKKRKRLRRKSSIASSVSSKSSSETSSNSARNTSTDEIKSRRNIRDRNILAESQLKSQDRTILDPQDRPTLQTSTRMNALKMIHNSPKIASADDPSLQDYIVLSDDESDLDIEAPINNTFQQEESEAFVPAELPKHIHNNAPNKKMLSTKQEKRETGIPDVIDLDEIERKHILSKAIKEDSQNAPSSDNQSELSYDKNFVDTQIVPVDSLNKVFESISRIKLPRNLPPTDHQCLAEKLQELKQIRYNQMVNLLQETSENFISICKLEKEKIGIQRELTITKCKSYYEKLLYEQEKEIQKKKLILDELLNRNVKTSS